MITVIEIQFEHKEVEKLFTDLNDIRGSKNLMQRKIGTELTRAVKRKYNQIVAFSSFYALKESGIGKIEALEGNKKGLYSIHITGNYRLILQPVSEDLSSESLKNCDTIIVKGVVDYHGKSAKDHWIIP